MLNIKPVLTLTKEGKLEAYAKVHGLEVLVQEPHRRAPNVRPRGYGENFAPDRRMPWTH